MRGVEQVPWLYDALCAVVDRLGLARWRRWVAHGAHGRTLEVGCGTGRNLLLYGSAARVVGLDPSLAALRRARRRAPRTPLVAGSAEALPFRDGAFDTLVSSLVFCSVADAARGLSEARRVLACGGHLRLLEHVRSTRPWRARWQDRLQPLWTRLSGGCHPNRDTEAAVEAAGFVVDPRERRVRGDLRRLVARPGRRRERRVQADYHGGDPDRAATATDHRAGEDTMAEPRSFSIKVGDEVLADLRARLDRVRWPDEVPGGGWAYGTDLAYMHELVGHWRERYDWRVHEARLNRLRQFAVQLGGIDVHFIHEPGRGPAPMPLLISHGWPGSVAEFERIIPMLTDPAAFGADPADAFTVVAPSLPGYGFSYRPGQPRFDVAAIADVFASLMTDVLGYRRFAAQGGDWGAFVTTRLGIDHAARLAGIHITLLAMRRDPAAAGASSEEERAFQEELRRWQHHETGYQWIQGTRPQTLAYGLTDSPVGLAAWIVEKFRTWSDCGGDVERRFTKDELLTNVMLYWITGCINASFWPYWARHQRGWPLGPDERVAVPTAYACFPAEILHPPRARAERVYDIRRWTVMPAGGHFAAMEEPEALARDIREFFRDLR